MKRFAFIALSMLLLSGCMSTTGYGDGDGDRGMGRWYSGGYGGHGYGRYHGGYGRHPWHRQW